MLKYLLSFLFIVRVSVPMGFKQTYEAKRYETFDGFYSLYLTDGKKVLVPIMFTIIEEK